ncbi:MAG: hypothetical protein KAS32_29690 [Candidatus Peribacteraceae bacterium]|nr:hypothetical protein [Candidatus Peribacteraceae bacterium]
MGGEEGYGDTVNIFISLGSEEKEEKREKKPNQLSEALFSMHADMMAKLEEIRAKTGGSSHQGGA